MKQITDSEVKSSIKSSISGTKDNSYLTYLGCSLLNESKLKLRLYFINNSNLTLEQLKKEYPVVSVSNKNPLEVKTGIESNLYYVTIDNISYNNLKEQFTVRIGNGSDDIKMKISSTDYIKIAMDSKDEKLKNLCKALYILAYK